MRIPYFEIYADKAGKYRWRFISGNSKTIASSNECFYDKSTAKRAARTVRMLSRFALIKGDKI